MWICVSCGETTAGTPERCEVCGRVREAPRFNNSPGFRPESPQTPRNTSPAVSSRTWIPESAGRPAPSGAPRVGRHARPEEPEPERRGREFRLTGPLDRGHTAEEKQQPEPVERRAAQWYRLVPALPLAVLIVALTTAGVLGGPRLFGSAPQAAPTFATPAKPPAVIPERIGEPGTVDRTESADRGAPANAQVGGRLVTVAAAVTDERAPRVTAMLETYFAGINAKDYERVAEVLDPAGTVDPGDPEHMAALSDGTATTRNSRVVLRRLTETGPGGRLLRAEVSFRSRQEAGDGPDERLDETCTDWRVVYTVSTGAVYRMLDGKGTSKPC